LPNTLEFNLVLKVVTEHLRGESTHRSANLVEIFRFISEIESCIDTRIYGS